MKYAAGHDDRKAIFENWKYIARLALLTVVHHRNPTDTTVYLKPKHPTCLIAKLFGDAGIQSSFCSIKGEVLKPIHHLGRPTVTKSSFDSVSTAAST